MSESSVRLGIYNLPRTSYLRLSQTCTRNMENSNARKRQRSCSPLPWQRPSRPLQQHGPPSGALACDPGLKERKEQESFAREQTRRNQPQEAEQMREWVSKEDEFVLKQAKKKAQIRVREGRAKPIDWLAVILSIIDPSKDHLEDESSDSDLNVMDPEGIIECLNEKELQGLEKDIDSYMILESTENNLAYWKVCSCGYPRVSSTNSRRQ